MNKTLMALKYVFYFFIGLWLLYSTKHDFTILLFIRDIFFCIGLYSMLDFISDEIEHRIIFYRINKDLKKADEFIKSFKCKESS